MSNTDVILEFLEVNRSGRYCDDCLSSHLGITPRQQVNQISNRLQRQGAIQRERGLCSLCSRHKIVNGFEPSGPEAPQRESRREPPATVEVPDSLGQPRIDVEKVRTRIVRMCRDLWRSQKGGDPPTSISAVINILKDDGLLPRHEANMMLTLCHLRNVYVYECIRMGPSERAVAQGAYNIVTKWWESLGADSA